MGWPIRAADRRASKPLSVSVCVSEGNGDTEPSWLAGCLSHSSSALTPCRSQTAGFRPLSEPYLIHTSSFNAVQPSDLVLPYHISFRSASDILYQPWHTLLWLLSSCSVSSVVRRKRRQSKTERGGSSSVLCLRCCQGLRCESPWKNARKKSGPAAPFFSFSRLRPFSASKTVEIIVNWRQQQRAIERERERES